MGYNALISYERTGVGVYPDLTGEGTLNGARKMRILNVRPEILNTLIP